MYQITLSLENINGHHSREVFTFLEILGLIGGLGRAFNNIFGGILLLYSKNSFVMDLASLLFRLKVKDAQILNKTSPSKDKEEVTDITFDFKTSVELFLL